MGRVGETNLGVGENDTGFSGVFDGELGLSIVALRKYQLLSSFLYISFGNELTAIRPMARDRWSPVRVLTSFTSKDSMYKSSSLKSLGERKTMVSIEVNLAVQVQGQIPV
jgi:hypothetical protein